MTSSLAVSRHRRSWSLFVLVLVALAISVFWVAQWHSAGSVPAAAVTAGQPALTVSLARAQQVDWPRLLVAHGSIAAWQEAVIGAEISHYRLTEVLVEVGDWVKPGQVLARISSDNVAAELAQSKAGLAEAQATLAEAQANAERARRMQTSGGLSPQQIKQYLTAEQTAAARVQGAQAKLQVDELRLAQTQVLAPDAGVIAARSATIGSLAQSGQELFRLIRGGRLEWRAEVTEAELSRLTPGTPATLILANGAQVRGRVRLIGPTVDPQTRQGLVYVDLATEGTDSPARAGMFARGELHLGQESALTLPQSAVLLREGFAYVFRLEGDDRVAQGKVGLGRRRGDRVEITEGLDAQTRVVESGVGFLADGDRVRVLAGAGPDGEARP